MKLPRFSGSSFLQSTGWLLQLWALSTLYEGGWHNFWKGNNGMAIMFFGLWFLLACSLVSMIRRTENRGLYYHQMLLEWMESVKHFVVQVTSPDGKTIVQLRNTFVVDQPESKKDVH